MHEVLLHAYFAENRDISDMDTLRALWAEASLPETGFDALEDPDLLAEMIEQHREALEAGATGVPAVRMAGNPALIVGAHPLALYRRWVERVQHAGRGSGSSAA